MIDVADHDGVTVVTLQHGKVNAMDLELVQAISTTFRGLPTHAPVVLTGAGRAFSAGVDLTRIVEGGTVYAASFVPALSECFLAVFDHPAPVVAAVNGHAIAGGCVLAAAADVRVASAGRIGLVELSVGVPLPVAATEICAGVVGHHLRDLVTTARLLELDEARTIGLVDELAAPEALLDAATAHARRLAAVPPEVFAVTKEHLQQGVRGRIAAHRSLDERITALWATEAVQSAVRAYAAGL